eukprot:scaffold222244_cov41-Prasinocladus_malaysianus.AAC.1
MQDTASDDVKSRVLNRLRKVGLGAEPIKDMRFSRDSSSAPGTPSKPTTSCETQTGLARYASSEASQ